MVLREEVTQDDVVQHFALEVIQASLRCHLWWVLHNGLSLRHAAIVSATAYERACAGRLVSTRSRRSAASSSLLQHLGSLLGQLESSLKVL